jgi:DNA-binding MarR family transcriptional regulator
MKHDFLKHWRVVRYLIKKQYGLSQQDLEMLLFLHSEGRFTKQDFAWYETILSWDVERFVRLKKEGWIKQWRSNYGRSVAIYELTHKGKIAMGRVYRLLLEEEKFPESRRSPIYKHPRNSEYKYFNAMKKINREESI